jgi:Fe-S-cluster containining protein
LQAYRLPEKTRPYVKFVPVAYNEEQKKGHICLILRPLLDYNQIMRELLAIPESAKNIHQKINVILGRLLALDISSPLLPSFTLPLSEMLEQFEEYQRLVVSASAYRLSCAKGCHQCCNHWVDNVYSFEAEIIADNLRRFCPAELPAILERFESDEREFEKITQRVSGGSIDPSELALIEFYRLNRPCAILDDHGRCRVYPHRPMMCRIYLCFSDPEGCDPKSPHHGSALTYLLDLEEEADESLDKLDKRFRKFERNTGLRSLLAQTLREVRTGG